ncbi:cytochrome P450 [Vararia minispora EC-137]|uniref:Cytochrome P450 n=1 Tax=Vararia minispora EC-137 TaxID=1314806 RepID=A0ACB8QXS7_9AGAM|nr:cytochrome P450 [Vararia minispora EC-137]
MPPSSIPLEYTAFVALACSLLWIATKPSRPLPPGPRGLPFVGNLFDFPTFKPWEVFASWGEKYGPIMSAKAMGHTFIIINDEDIANSIVVEGGMNYADRPTSVLFEIANMQSFVTGPYEGRIRAMRQMIARLMGTPTNIRKYYPIMDYHAIKMVKDLSHHKDGETTAMVALRKASAAVALHLTYGYVVKDDPGVQDPLIALAEKMLDTISKFSAQGKRLVEIFPLLRYWPSWMPGSGFKRDIKKSYESIRIACQAPFEWVVVQMQVGTAQESFVRDLLSEEGITNEGRALILSMASSIYGAAVETTAAAISAYIIASCLYPEVQERFHAELDRVVGTDRLPTLDDRARLPYAEAVCKEALRWVPTIPLAFPHLASQEGVYNQYRIPKGSLVITNIWAMQHDPAKHPDPMVFRPERYLGPNPEHESWKNAFGFGKRMCPGKNFIDPVLFITITKIAAVFNITKAIGPDGKAVEPRVGSSRTGNFPYGMRFCARLRLTVVHSGQDPFPCNIQPRSEAVLRMVSDAHSFPPFQLDPSAPSLVV